MFIEYKYGGNKAKITKLLRERQDLKKRVRYHDIKILHHQKQIKEIENVKLLEVETELNKFLENKE